MPYKNEEDFFQDLLYLNKDLHKNIFKKFMEDILEKKNDKLYLAILCDECGGYGNECTCEKLLFKEGLR